MKNRLKSILSKIEDIEFFIQQKNGKIMLALEDRILKAKKVESDSLEVEKRI